MFIYNDGFGKAVRLGVKESGINGLSEKRMFLDKNRLKMEQVMDKVIIFVI